MAGTKNISINIANIFKKAKEDKWVVEYDSDLDSFYWMKPKLSKNSKLKKFLEDFSLYVSQKGEIEGLFIEYAKYNFLSHNPDYGRIFDVMENSEGDTYILKQEDEKSVDSLLKNMADKVGNETLEAIGKGLDLEKMVNA